MSSNFRHLEKWQDLTANTEGEATYSSYSSHPPIYQGLSFRIILAIPFYTKSSNHGKLYQKLIIPFFRYLFTNIYVYILYIYISIYIHIDYIPLYQLYLKFASIAVPFPFVNAVETADFMQRINDCNFDKMLKAQSCCETAGRTLKMHLFYFWKMAESRKLMKT